METPILNEYDGFTSIGYEYMANDPDEYKTTSYTLQNEVQPEYNNEAKLAYKFFEGVEKCQVNNWEVFKCHVNKK